MCPVPSPLQISPFMLLTWSRAAMDPAATPAAVNPAPAKTAGAAKTAATPVPTAATVFPDTSVSWKKKNEKYKQSHMEIKISLATFLETFEELICNDGALFQASAERWIYVEILCLLSYRKESWVEIFWVFL